MDTIPTTTQRLVRKRYQLHGSVGGASGYGFSLMQAALCDQQFDNAMSPAA